MSYSFGSEHYSLNYKLSKDWIENAVKSAVKPLKDTYVKMLDMGCGTGEDTMFMGEFFHAQNIIGIDRNESYINYARKNNTFNSRANYEACDLNKTKDVQSILDNNEDIDLVVSSFSLQLVDDPLMIFKTLFPFSKRGHVEHVHIFTQQIFEPVINVITNIPNHQKWKNYLKDVKDIPRSMTKQEPKIPSDDFRQELSKMNYEICTECIIPIITPFESYKEIIECLRWLLPLTKYIPSDLQDEFLQDCWTEYIKNWSFDKEFIIGGDICVLHLKHH